jgi:hypothetical protein
MTVTSAPIRMSLRIRPVRAGRMYCSALYLPDPLDLLAGSAGGPNTTRSRLGGRSLMAASRALAPRFLPSMVRLETLNKLLGGDHE